MQGCISGLRLSCTPAPVQYRRTGIGHTDVTSRRMFFCTADGKTPPRDHFKDFAKEMITRISDDSRGPLSKMQQPGVIPSSESIHHLRVGLRRGRTVSRHLCNILALPKEARETNVSRVIQVLGGQRDRDVMQETLSEVMQLAGDISDHEHMEADKAIAHLRSLHQQAAEGVLDMVNQQHPQHVLDAFEEWLLEPRFKKAGRKFSKLPAHEAAPAMLLPKIEKVFSHPGWQINAIEKKRSRSKIDSSLLLSEVIDSGKCEKIHALRKQLRELRYLMDFLLPLYEDAEAYASQLLRVKRMQDQLGKLQDLQVLGHFLEPYMPKMPTIASSLLKLHTEVWEEWLECRKKLRKTKGMLQKVISNPYQKADGESGKPQKHVSKIDKSLEKSGKALIETGAVHTQDYESVPREEANALQTQNYDAANLKVVNGAQMNGALLEHQAARF